MGDSDTENEKFVENVMHELQAFHITDRPKIDDDDQSADTKIDRGTKSEMQQSSERVDDSGKLPPAESKVPTRIIKLSRPSTQFSSSRAQAPSQSETDTSVSDSSNVNGISSSSTLASAVSSTPAPGSRLAALQRPGSPFHKYLQRAQSPALAAAAKLAAQKSGSATAGTAAQGDNTSKESSKQENDGNVIQNGDTNSNDATGTDGKPDQNSNQSPGRSSIIPPRIQSSALSSSVLLRRPQSPLHGSRNSHIPLNRQVAGVSAEDTDSAGPKSPKSPKSDAPASPGMTAADSITSADKVAIRNKLRANSFRLKDLLTKRPFVKSQDQEDSETKDDSETATHRLNESSRSTSLPVDNSGDGETSKDRPRVSALLLRSRSRNSGDRPPPTLISARSLRTRNTDKSSTEPKEENANKTDATPKEASIINTVESVNKVTSNIVTNHESAISASGAKEEPSSVQGASSSDIKGVSDNNATVGATLLRSPRTRISSSEPTVPSESNISQQGPDIPKDSHYVPKDTHDNLDTLKSTNSNNDTQDSVTDQSTVNTVDQNTSAVCNQNHNNALTAKSKAISELEKEADVNLVFDSETIGQSEHKALNACQNVSSIKPEKDVMSQSLTSNSLEARDLAGKSDLKEIQEARKSAKESFMSQSMTASSVTPRWRDWRQQRQRVTSEPGTSLTDDSGATDKGHTKSTDEKSGDENIKNVDFSRSSPALKRSLAVTDLDKAMRDRDQQKLSSIFKEGSQDNTEKEDEAKPKGELLLVYPFACTYCSTCTLENLVHDLCLTLSSLVSEEDSSILELGHVH